MATLYLLPTGDSFTQWSDWPAAGDHYEKVDDGVSHDSDGTYVYTTDDNKRDVFAMADSADLGTINWVKAWAIFKAISTSNAEMILGIDSGGTEVETSTTFFSGSYQGISLYRTTDPNTSSAWTWAGVNAAELYIKSDETVKFGFSGTLRCTAVYFEVDYTPTPVGGRRVFLIT